MGNVMVENEEIVVNLIAELQRAVDRGCPVVQFAFVDGDGMACLHISNADDAGEFRIPCES